MFPISVRPTRASPPYIHEEVILCVDGEGGGQEAVARTLLIRSRTISGLSGAIELLPARSILPGNVKSNPFTGNRFRSFAGV